MKKKPVTLAKLGLKKEMIALLATEKIAGGVTNTQPQGCTLARTECNVTCIGTCPAYTINGSCNITCGC